MRQVARDCGCPVETLGPVIEEPGFWDGIDARAASNDWLARASMVVLPAWIEHWPRRLLRAAAAGVPVIATTACGLAGVPNVVEISPGDIETLRAAVLASGALSPSLTFPLRA